MARGGGGGGGGRRAGGNARNALAAPGHGFTATASHASAAHTHTHTQTHTHAPLHTHTPAQMRSEDRPAPAAPPLSSDAEWSSGPLFESSAEDADVSGQLLFFFLFINHRLSFVLHQ